MNTMLKILFVTAATLGAATARAQQQASTLFSLARSADTVVVATATADFEPSPEWRSVEFRVDETMKGATRATFSVLEPSGRCCGAALSAAEPGRQFVMFLKSRGPALHPMAGDRGIVASSPDLIAHVRELIAAAGDSARETQLLAQSLAHTDIRVAQDAALALAAHPRPELDARSMQRVHEALDRCVAMPTTALPSLATAVARAEGHAAAAALIPLYLRATSEDSASAICGTLASLPGDQIAAALRAETVDDDTACIRAANLLEQKPDMAQLDVLQKLLREARTPRASTHVVSALLAHGVDPKTLSRQVHKSVLAAAVKRRDQLAMRSVPFASPPR